LSKTFFTFRLIRALMSLRAATSLPVGRLLQLTAIVAFVAMLNGCISLAASEKIASREEPQDVKSFLLTADESSYTVSRWWNKDYETVAIPRRDLPAGCETARFFLNDTSHELRIAIPASSPWVAGKYPPLPDDNYPPCALLISYGYFSGPPELEGVVITSSTGLVANDERQRPQPAIWALAPAGMIVEGYAMVGATLTLPIWGPIAYFSAEEEKTSKEQAKSKIPPPVTACWNSIDDKLQNGWIYDMNIQITGYEWIPENESAYTLTPVNEPCGDDNATHVDTRVTLHNGLVRFRSLEAKADIECGLQSGNVVNITLKPHN